MITPASQLQYKVNPKLAVERDRFGRPLIETPDGRIRPYTRASTLGNRAFFVALRKITGV